MAWSSQATYLLANQHLSSAQEGFEIAKVRAVPYNSEFAWRNVSSTADGKGLRLTARRKNSATGAGTVPIARVLRDE